MLRFSKAVAAALVGLLVPAVVQAETLSVDGIAGVGEYNGFGSITRTDTALTTTRYLSTDSHYVYLAIIADVTDADWASHLPFVNGYLYSSTGQSKIDGSGTGVYGTNDDLIIEGLNLKYARNGTGGIWSEAMPDGGLAQVSSEAGGSFVYANATYGVTVGMNHTTGVWEASVPRSLVSADLYASLRFGGQAWAYDNTFNNFSMPAAVAPVPLPMAAFGALPLLGIIGLRRKWSPR